MAMIQRWLDRRSEQHAETDADRAYIEAQRNDILLLIEELDEKERQLRNKRRGRPNDH